MPVVGVPTREKVVLIVEPNVGTIDNVVFTAETIGSQVKSPVTVVVDVGQLISPQSVGHGFV